MDKGKSPKKAFKKKRPKMEKSDSDNSDDEIVDYGNGLDITLGGNDTSASSDGGWSSDDDRELVDKVKSISKSTDKANYKTRLRQLNWSNIAFKNYTPEDCEKRFLEHLKNVRRHRTLNEIATDIEANIKKCPIKKPLNSYQIYVQEQLSNVTSSGDFAETMRNLASRYKSLSPGDRAVYESKASQLRDEYKMKKLQFLSGNVPVSKVNASATLKLKTPFQLYAEHHQADGDHTKLRDQYANLSMEEKYNWVLKAVNLDPEQSTKVLNKEEIRIFKGQMKHTPSAYSLFVKKMYSKLREQYNSKEIFVEIAQRWKSMDPKTKQTYIKEATIMKEEVAKEQEEFNKRIGITPKTPKRRKSVYVEKSPAIVKESDDDGGEETTPKKKRKISASSDSAATDDKNTKQIKIQPKSSSLKSPTKFTEPTPTKELKVKKEKQKSNSISESSEFNEVGESDAASSSTSTSSKKKKKKEKKEKAIQPPGEKPPSDFETYFAKYVHTGKPHKAKKALAKLTKKELKQLKAEYNEKVESYVNNLKAYCATLSREEAVAYISKLKEIADAEKQNNEVSRGSSSQE